MPEIEELEHRITRLEALYEDVLKEKITYIMGYTFASWLLIRQPHINLA